MRSMGSVTRLHRRLLNYLFVGKFYGLWIMSWQIGNILGVDSVRRLWSETPKFLITRPFVLLITRLGDDFKRHTMQKWWTKNKGLATKKLHNKNDVKIYLINYLPKSAILLHPVPPHSAFVRAGSVCGFRGSISIVFIGVWHEMFASIPTGIALNRLRVFYGFRSII